MKITNLKRIKAVLEYYRSRGANSERVNKIYRKILKDETRNY